MMHFTGQQCLYRAVEKWTKDSNPEKYEEARESSREHLKFACRNYQHQYDAGRVFLHEHPQQASSWNEGCMRKIVSLPGVSWVDMHQRQLGQTYGQGHHAKRPTRWFPNSRHILKKLHVKRQGRGGWRFQGGEWKQNRPCYGRVAIHSGYARQSWRGC